MNLGGFIPLLANSCSLYLILADSAYSPITQIKISVHELNVHCFVVSMPVDTNAPDNGIEQTVACHGLTNGPGREG